MSDLITNNFEESIAVKQKTLAACKADIEAAAQAIIFAIEDGGKMLLFGNGGSAADAQHMAAEFIGRFLKERRSLPAVALTTNSSSLTCLGNDYGYDTVFARQIEALGKKGDIAFGITTSGGSANVVAAFKKARSLGLKTIALTGCGGGKCKDLADIYLCVPSQETPRIQETHLLLYHTICQLVEDHFA